MIIMRPPLSVKMPSAKPLREKIFLDGYCRPHSPSGISSLFVPTGKVARGLGLANVRKIVEYHGGLVAGNNDLEEGALFLILLPVKGYDL